MPRFRKSHLKPLIFTLLIALACLLALTATGRRFSSAALTPLVGLATRTFEGLANLVRAFQPGPHSRKDLLHAQAIRIEELQTALAATEDLRRQNAELRQALNLPPTPEWKGVFAEIIARDPERWDERLVIGGGSADGLVTGAVVLANGRVIGRVLQTHRHSAEVVTILSEECRFGVALADTGTVGVLQGIGARRTKANLPACLVNFLPKNIVVKEGQEIITSGLGGWMPGGLPVGRAVNDPTTGDAVNIVDSAYAQLWCAPHALPAHSHFVTVMVPQSNFAETP